VASSRTWRPFSGDTPADENDPSPIGADLAGNDLVEIVTVAVAK